MPEFMDVDFQCTKITTCTEMRKNVIRFRKSLSVFSTPLGLRLSTEHLAIPHTKAKMHLSINICFKLGIHQLLHLR